MKSVYKIPTLLAQTIGCAPTIAKVLIPAFKQPPHRTNWRTVFMVPIPFEDPCALHLKKIPQVVHAQIKVATHVCLVVHKVSIKSHLQDVVVQVDRIVRVVDYFCIWYKLSQSSSWFQ
jgi:hypothetical protein